MKKSIAIGVIVFSSVFVTAGQVPASVISVTGDVEFIDPEPNDLSLFAVESATKIRVFNETQDIVSSIPSTSIVEAFASAGQILNTTPGGSIPVGSNISHDVHLIHMDQPVNGNGEFGRLSGTITFDAPIVGFFFTGGALDATDSLGLASVYEPSTGWLSTNDGGEIFGRGTDLGSTPCPLPVDPLGPYGLVDCLVVSADLLTLTVSLVDGDLSDFSMDELRVITAESTVPLPGAFWLFGSGLLVLTVRSARAKA